MLKTEIALQQIITEYNRAKDRFEDFNSTHEGYAVVQQKLDELREAVWAGEKSATLRAQAKQLAAMTMRFMTDCT